MNTAFWPSEAAFLALNPSPVGLTKLPFGPKPLPVGLIKLPFGPEASPLAFISCLLALIHCLLAFFQVTFIGCWLSGLTCCLTASQTASRAFPKLPCWCDNIALLPFWPGCWACHAVFVTSEHTPLDRGPPFSACCASCNCRAFQPVAVAPCGADN